MNFLDVEPNHVHAVLTIFLLVLLVGFHKCLDSSEITLLVDFVFVQFHIDDWRSVLAFVVVVGIQQRELNEHSFRLHLMETVVSDERVAVGHV